jgi:hypothetical protein
LITRVSIRLPIYRWKKPSRISWNIKTRLTRGCFSIRHPRQTASASDSAHACFCLQVIFYHSGGAAPAADEFLANLKLDIDDIHAFRETHGAAVIVDMFEVALPSSALTDSTQAHDLVKESSDMLNKNGITVFFESSSGEGWQPRAENLIRALRKLKDRHVGFKLRTGGVTADAFPSTEQVAWAIASVRDAGVPIKCTAGLHHPVRHYNDSVQAKMHGFLNVFGAGVLAEAKDLSQAQIQSILEDENPENTSPSMKTASVAWKDLRVANGNKEFPMNIENTPICHFLWQLQFRRTARRLAKILAGREAAPNRVCGFISFVDEMGGPKIILLVSKKFMMKS